MDSNILCNNNKKIGLHYNSYKLYFIYIYLYIIIFIKYT